MNRLSNLLLCFLCFAAFSISAQNIPNNSFYTYSSDTCAYNNATPQNKLDDWKVYQTRDSVRWGIEDSVCFPSVDISASWNKAAVDVNDLNIGYPLYFKSEISDSTKIPLDSNTVYSFEMWMYHDPFNTVLFDTSCKEGICTGLLIGIEVPDSAGTGTDIRWHDAVYSQSNGAVYACVPTEKFPQGNFLRRLFIKFTLDSSSIGEVIRPAEVNIYQTGWMLSKVRGTRTAAPSAIGQEYSFSYDYYPSTYLIMHDSAGYPNANNISYLEIQPSANLNVQQNITVTVEPWENLVMQPFTSIRGTQVVGDTIHHTITMVNNGGSVCLPFIELVFNGNGGYHHKKGTLSFDGQGSCLMFTRGGSLIVEPGETFVCGKPGKGMLALRSGANVRIGRNAELRVQNKLVFGRNENRDDEGHIYIDLNRGSTLSFAEGSRVIPHFSPDGKSRIYVRMRGGILDLSGLPAADRKYIVPVYDSPLSEFAQSVKVHGNPFSETLSVSFIPDGEWNYSAQLFDLQGKMHHREVFTSYPGMNFVDLDTRNLPAGTYFLVLETPLGKVSKQTVKVD